MKMFIAMTLLMSLGMSKSIAGFINLDEQQRYAASVPEFPQESPESGYQKLYASLTPSWLHRTLSQIGLRKKPAWKPSDANLIISSTYELLTKTSSNPKVTLTLLPDSECIVFGGVRGAFHSLTRALHDLQKRGIIDTTYRLKPGVYMVFLGDTLDYSAYALETLSLILTLQKANTRQVVFLAGHVESNQTWHSSGLHKELILRLPNQIAELTKKIDTIFSKLPRELLVRLEGTSDSLLFSAFTKEHEQGVSAIITSDEKAPSYHEGQGLYKKVPQEGPITWQVVSSPIREYRMKHRFFYDAYALIQLSTTLKESIISLYASKGTVPFTLSATYNLLTGTVLTRGRAFPTMHHTPNPLSAQERALHISTLKELTDNLQNELASLTIQIDLPQSDSAAPTIELPPLIKKLAEGASLTPQEMDEALSDIEFLYNTLSTEMIHLRSLAQKNGLKLASPTSSDSKTTITLGSSLDLSKSAKGLGIPFKTGMSLKVHEQNRAGGIHGKRAHIIFLDDAYRPALAEKNIETFLSVDHTPFILAPVGSPTLAASLDLIEQKKILVLFPQSGSLLFRKPLLTHVINFRASFHDEGRLLTEFVIEKYRSKKFVFFYQDDEFGTGVLEGAKDALKTMKNTQATEVGYQANTTSFESLATKIKEANPDAIGLFATGPAVLQLIRDLGVEFLANKILFAVSSVGDAVTKKVLQERGISLIMGQVVPDLTTSTLPIVVEYRKELAAQGLKEDVFGLEAYINTSLTFNAMNSVSEPITMSKLIEHFEQMKQYEYKGLTLTFDPKSRSLGQNMWIINKNGTAHEMKIGGSHEKGTP